MGEVKPKLKAYCCEEPFTGFMQIEYFENVGQAKAWFAGEFSEEYIDVRPRRLPWADEYNNADNIPIEVFFEHGWWFQCNTCNREIMSIEDFFENKYGYCCRGCYEMGE